MKIDFLKNSVIIFLTLFLIQCKTIKEKNRAIVFLPKIISDSKLYDNLIDNMISDYHSINIKKANISYQINDKSKNLSSTIRILKDSIIWISVKAPLKIEVARLLCTPDSIKFLDRIHKKHFVSDYSYLNDMYGINLTYSHLQSILTNSVFSIKNINDKKTFVKKYKGKTKDRKYVFNSKFYNKFHRKQKKNKGDKPKFKKFEDIIEESITIDPNSFRIIKINLNDFFSSRRIQINYDEFKKSRDESAKLFPHKIACLFENEKNSLRVNFKVHRIEFDKEFKTPFSIPSKYTLMQ